MAKAKLYTESEERQAYDKGYHSGFEKGIAHGEASVWNELRNYRDNAICWLVAAGVVGCIVFTIVSFVHWIVS
jgi:hypothetical protein